MRKPKLDPNRKRSSALFFLVLVLLGLVLVPEIPKVHAGSPFVNEAHMTDCAGPTCVTPSLSITAGNLLLVDIFDLTNDGASITDALGNSFTLRMDATSGGNIRQQLWTATIVNGGTDSVTITSADGTTSRYEAQLVQYTGITGIGTNGNDVSQSNPSTFSSTITITTSAPSVVYDGWDVTNAGGSCASLSPVTGSLLFTFNCDTSTGAGKNALSSQTVLSGGPGTFQFTDSWTGATGGAGNNAQVHFVIELDLAPATAPSTSTQCYGNCGNPPITLVNTNSTHTIKFNQTITIFYEFQSNLNGFLLNETVNVAKPYTNGQQIFFMVYTIPSCPSGQTPFSSACPGLATSGGASPVNPVKGQTQGTLANLHVGVTNGEWIGIAVTAQFGPLDLNDTNTNVNLFQTNEGKNPAVIQQGTLLANSKLGLWAWISGSPNVGATPQNPTNCVSLATLDCLLPNLVNSLCTNSANSQCQTSSALFWVLVFTIISEFAIGMSFAKISPNLKIPIGETFTFILLIWIFVMTGLSLIVVWVPVFFFMVISLFFSKHTGKFF